MKFAELSTGTFFLLSCVMCHPFISYRILELRSCKPNQSCRFVMKIISYQWISAKVFKIYCSRVDFDYKYLSHNGVQSVLVVTQWNVWMTSLWCFLISSWSTSAIMLIFRFLHWYSLVSCYSLSLPPYVLWLLILSEASTQKMQVKVKK